MERILIRSTAIRSIGYDEASHILEMQMISGSVYRYHAVPLEIYLRLMASYSKGRFYNKYIKNHYRAT